MALLEDDGKCLEGEVEYPKDKCVPVLIMGYVTRFSIDGHYKEPGRTV